MSTEWVKEHAKAMQPKQKPSIGRIVHVQWFGDTLPAIITKVRSDTEIDVTVFGSPDESKGAHRVTWLMLDDAPDSPATHGTWKWPPRS